MFLKYPIICSHVYCYSNKALPPPPRASAIQHSRTGQFCNTSCFRVFLLHLFLLSGLCVAALVRFRCMLGYCLCSGPFLHVGIAHFLIVYLWFRVVFWACFVTLLAMGVLVAFFIFPFMFVCGSISGNQI
jgi:hypothetical protein